MGTTFSILSGGMVTGAVYALLAMGLVLIYKATRVPNFAYGGLACFLAFFHYNLVTGKAVTLNLDVLYLHLHWHHVFHLGFWSAFPITLVVAAAMGLLIERLVIRPFAKAPMVTMVIVTLALNLFLTGLAGQLFGTKDLVVSNKSAIFSRSPAVSLGGVNFSYERLGVVAVVLLVSAAVWAFFRFTATGLAIRAAATDRDVASLLGVSTRQLAVVSWVSGSVVAAVAGIALASVVISSNPTLLLLLSVKGFAAAIVGGMLSFPIAVLAGFGIGIGEEAVRQLLVVHDAKLFAGAPEVLTLGAVIAVLALRPSWIFKGIREDEDSGITGQAGSQEFVLARMIDPVEAYRLFRAAVPTNSAPMRRVARVLAVGVPAVLALFALTFPALPLPSFWALPANLTLIYLLVALSFVVLVGWLGQVSVAQGAFVAVGGAGVAVCANTFHLPFPLPLIGAVLVSIPVSILVGLPALRVRGLHLVVATLAFGLAAERAIIPHFSQGGVRVALPSYLRSDVTLYYFFLALTAAVFVFAMRIQRTRVGRSFFAIRDSETVAAAYGIRPVRVKLTGFVISGAIAALAGAMLTYQLGSLVESYASVGFSIQWLGNAVVGGITSIAGPLIAALLFGLYPELTKSAVSASNISHVPEMVSAVLVIVIMAVNPGGLASMSRFVRARATAHDAEVDGAPEPPVVAPVFEREEVLV
ncbi:MAG TPA: ABC transporter permease [Acidimicrobiales bacterium]|nr:ABC transporter permease [Acidimicrobiales bacterium]